MAPSHGAMDRREFVTQCREALRGCGVVGPDVTNADLLNWAEADGAPVAWIADEHTRSSLRKCFATLQAWGSSTGTEANEALRQLRVAVESSGAASIAIETRASPRHKEEVETPTPRAQRDEDADERPSRHARTYAGAPYVTVTFLCYSDRSKDHLTKYYEAAHNFFHEAITLPEFALRDQAQRLANSAAGVGPAEMEHPFGTITIAQPVNTKNGEQREATLEPLVYHMLPTTVEVKVESHGTAAGMDGAPGLQRLLHEGLLEPGKGGIRVDPPIIRRACTTRTLRPEEDEGMILERFENYTEWLVTGCVQFIRPHRLEAVFSTLKTTLIGVEGLVESMEKRFELFTDEKGDMPHGILLYGPPGTGKTTIIDKIMKMGVHEVCQPLSASDFSQPYVGEDVQLVNHMAARAKALPWQAVGVSIDEIDGLAPDRSAGSSGKTDLLNKILAAVAGNQNAKNLLLLGSTNNFDSMDEAFRRRINIKLFVGKPAFAARQKWIEWKAIAYGLHHFQSSGPTREELVAIELSRGGTRRQAEDRVLEYTPGQAAEVVRAHGVILDNRVVDFVVKATINFSNDAMRLLLRMLYRHYKAARERSNYNFAPPGGDWDTNQAALSKYLLDDIRQICLSERIFLGNHILPDLLERRNRGVSDSTSWKEEMLEFCAANQFQTVGHGQGGRRSTGMSAAGRDLVTHFALVDGTAVPEMQVGCIAQLVGVGGGGTVPHPTDCNGLLPTSLRVIPSYFGCFSSGSNHGLS